MSPKECERGEFSPMVSAFFMINLELDDPVAQVGPLAPITLNLNGFLALGSYSLTLILRRNSKLVGSKSLL